MVTWTRFTNSTSASPVWLMLDGSVLGCTGGQTLQFLHPDSKGSYANGQWSPAGSFLLERDAFASAVLPDGRLVVCGGENSGGLLQNETNRCEIYDPITKVSVELAPPTGWTNIGDSPSVVLPDGTFMIGNTQGHGKIQVALLDAASLTWTLGGGDAYIEQGYVLLKTGDVLTVSTGDLTSKRYVPELKQFVPDANLPVVLYDASSEIGPGIAMMDGRVVWFGATGHTCIYSPGPKGHNGSCAILEPNGKVFLAAWSGTSVFFLEYDPEQNTITEASNAPSTTNREAAKMLLLPNGHGLVWIDQPTNALYDLTFDSGAQASWAPTITDFPVTSGPNQPVTLSGTQLCGLSECQNFGDDNQQAENYPMVRFVDSGGGVTYARAHDVSTRSIAPGQPGSVLVDIPGSLPVGTYSVEAVAMGLPSNAVSVDLVVPRAGVIQGHVTDSSHKPIADATVYLSANAQITPTTGNSLQLSTDKNGFYETPEIPAQFYEITAIQSAYADSPVRIAVPGTTLDFVLTAALPFTVNGIVSAFDGGPLAGATVSLRIGVGNPSQTITQADGSYSLTTNSLGGPPSQGTLTASLAGFMAANVALTIPNGATVIQDLVLAQLGSLSGVITDTATSKPILGATLTAGTVSGRSDSTGAYSLKGLNPLPTDVVVSAPGYDPTQIQVTIAPGAAIILDLTLTLGSASLKGTVTSADFGTPLSATVTVVGFGETQTDATGRYTFTSIPAGDQLVEASVNRFYKPQTVSVLVSANQVLEQDFQLELVHQPKATARATGIRSDGQFREQPEVPH